MNGKTIRDFAGIHTPPGQPVIEGLNGIFGRHSGPSPLGRRAVHRFIRNGVFVLLATTSFIYVARAQHVVIDFDNLAEGVVVTNQYPEATFSSDSGLVNMTTALDFGTSLPNFICTAFPGGPINCTGTTQVDFTNPVDNLQFRGVGDDSAGVVARVSVYENGELSATVGVVADGNPSTPFLVELSAFSMVTRIVIHSIQDPAGVGWDDFEFDVTECFLVIGDGPGDATFFGISHLFETQIDGVEDSFGVLMDDIPEFVLPGPELSAIPTGMGIAGAGGGETFIPQTDIPSWMWDGKFTVQVLMWNPQVFPGQPEQFSYALKVHVKPDGSISTRPYGTGTGIALWAQTDVNAKGQPVVRFPFSIPGM